jgi:hypothetical protein
VRRWGAPLRLMLSVGMYVYMCVCYVRACISDVYVVEGVLDVGCQYVYVCIAKEQSSCVHDDETGS